MQKADMQKAESYYKHTYVFDRIVFNGAVNKLILHIPNPVRELIYQYIGTLSDKVRVIQRAWRRYTACNPYICGYYPHIDTIVKNMYPWKINNYCCDKVILGLNHGVVHINTWVGELEDLISISLLICIGCVFYIMVTETNSSI